jgi:hypothetical protein
LPATLGWERGLLVQAGHFEGFGQSVETLKPNAPAVSPFRGVAKRNLERDVTLVSAHVTDALRDHPISPIQYAINLKFEIRKGTTVVAPPGSNAIMSSASTFDAGRPCAERHVGVYQGDYRFEVPVVVGPNHAMVTLHILLRHRPGVSRFDRRGDCIQI